MSYHRSVLLKESIEALAIKPDGIYVDMTFGGGGHSQEILNNLGAHGRLYAFDQDINAQRNAIDDERFMLIQQNFEVACEYLMALGVEKVDGILADLGVSSFQLDDDDSGFSYRNDISLDMRMNKQDTVMAKDILNTYSEEKLQYILQEYGEVRNAKTLAQRIIEARAMRKYEKSDDLNSVFKGIQFGTFETYAAPIYQALRMEVNRELEVLQKMLVSSTDILHNNGRLAIISFHSLEDRIVKNFMKWGQFADVPETDIYGKRKPWNMTVLSKKPVTASEQELMINPRSRSAKLRIAEKKHLNS
jgi:16S rRNA (cytosine1402-N4)-methyltransferase